MSQKTIANIVEFKGIGGHLGVNANVVIKPANANTGILFFRKDIGEWVTANYKNVIDTRMCTVISNSSGASISTVEHLMSALSAFGIDNAVVEIDGPEMPIMDGSSLEYVKKFRECGIIDLDTPKKYVKVLREIEIENEGKRIKLTPSDVFEIRAEIDFDHPAIGNQKFCYTSSTDYTSEIAPARTFAFEKDIKMLQEIGLAQGASLEHGIGLSEDSVLNKEGLRFKDEFIRHKILDCIGDFALGGNIIASVDAYKMGHALNNAILHELFSNDANYIILSENQMLQSSTAEHLGVEGLVHAF